MQSTSSLHPLHLIIWLSFVRPVIVTNIRLYWLSKRALLANENSSFCYSSTVTVLSLLLLTAISRALAQELRNASPHCPDCLPFSDGYFLTDIAVRPVARQPNQPAEAALWSQTWMSGCKAGWLAALPSGRLCTRRGAAPWEAGDQSCSFSSPPAVPQLVQ